MKDSEFDDFLKTSRLDSVELPGTFKQRVWSRIEAESTTRQTSWVHALASFCFRPLGLSLTMATAVVFGIGLAAISPIHEERSGQLAYAESISPFHNSEAR